MRITLHRCRKLAVKIIVTIPSAHFKMCCCSFLVLFSLTAGCEKCYKRNRNIHTEVFSANPAKSQLSQMREEEVTGEEPEEEAKEEEEEEEDVDAEEAKEMRLQPKTAEEQEGMSTSQTAEEESAVEKWRENRQEENIMKASPGMSDGPASMMPMPLTMTQQVLKNV